MQEKNLKYCIFNMKEFTSQTGGRYTYIDDIMNLQDLALAFAGIFDGCDNFIISGCQVSGTNISAGYALSLIHI